MAYEELVTLSADTMISLGGHNKKLNRPNPTQVEGYYLGKEQRPDKKKKSGFEFVYFFQTAKGNVGVWGKTDLNKQMRGAIPGRMTLAKVLPEQRETPNGPMYVFKVYSDKDNTIDVSGLESSDSSHHEEAPAAYSASSSSFSDEEDTDLDSLDEMEAEPAPARPVAPSRPAAVNPSRAAALLAKNRK